MNFNYIDLENWERAPYFNHFINDVRCTYSMTANVDITSLLKTIKKKKIKLYPVLIYMITSIVNQNKKFRTCYDENEKVGIFDEMSPCYTVFHKDNETFSNIWTSYDNSFKSFYHNVLSDMDQYGNVKQFMAKDNVPKNTFPVSCIPWVSFTGFNLNIFADGTYLLPIFTIGKYFNQEQKTLIPISIQVHHAVCDGYHVSKFINQLEEMSLNFNDWLK